MFNATNITDLGDISSWDVNKVESFEAMFRNCQNLNSLSDLGLWNVSDSCNNLSLMFYNTGSILPDNLDLSGWDTEMLSQHHICSMAAAVLNTLISAAGIHQISLMLQACLNILQLQTNHF